MKGGLIMKRAQIENLYKTNGLEDYRLRNIEDLLKIYGINIKEVNGYNRLDDISRVLYEKFIVNIFNAFGLEFRSTLVPKGIYYVEEINYLAKDPDDGYDLVVGGIVKIIDRNGMKSVLSNRIDEDYKHFELTESEPINYLRFVYEHDGRKEWLHVKNENEWY